MNFDFFSNDILNAKLIEINFNYQNYYEDYINYKKINKKALDLYNEQMEILCN